MVDVGYVQRRDYITFYRQKVRSMRGWNCHKRVGQAGFTFVELISVVLIVGVLAVAVIPRLADRSVFDTRGFRDQTVSMLRYAQKLAVAQRTHVFVNVHAASNTVCLTYGAANPTCASGPGVIDVLNPANQERYSSTAPAGVSLSSSLAFSFSPLGKPSPDAQVSFNISGSGMTYAIVVERETGYVQ